jgi:hypothetical protein
VRGLTGQEMFQAKMAVDRDKTFRAAVAAMSAGGREQVAAFTDILFVPVFELFDEIMRTSEFGRSLDLIIGGVVRNINHNNFGLRMRII